MCITFIVVHYGKYLVCMGVGGHVSVSSFSQIYLHHDFSLLERRDQILKLQQNSSELMECWMRLFGT